MKYTVIRDTREQKGWTFESNSSCEEMITKTLRTGDYSLCGLEEIFVIERKGTSGEFAQNIVQNRFEKELQRLEQFKHPFIILEFTLQDIMVFPRESGIPPKIWDKVKISPWFILKRLIEYQITYKTKIILAGPHGKDVANSIFKRMAELYAPAEEEETK